MAQRIVDLSLDVYDGYPAHPEDVPVSLRPYATHAEHGYQTTRITVCSHTGTHMDAPFHFFPDGRSIDRLDLRKCMGPALVIDATRRVGAGDIRVADLPPQAGALGRGSRVLFRTDWDRQFNTPRFYDQFPGISYELAQWLADREVGLVGVQTPAIHATEYVRVHKALLGREIVLVEALAHMDQLRAREVQFIALPLRIRGGDGSPVRALAIEEE